MWFVVTQVASTAYTLSGPFRRREIAEKAAVGALASDKFISAKVVRASSAWLISSQEAGNTLSRELMKMGVKKPTTKNVPQPSN